MPLFTAQIKIDSNTLKMTSVQLLRRVRIRPRNAIAKVSSADSHLTEQAFIEN